MGDDGEITTTQSEDSFEMSGDSKTLASCIYPTYCTYLRNINKVTVYMCIV